MTKLKKGQNVNNSTEEIDVALDSAMSMDSELIGKFITQQIAAAMVKKTRQYERKILKMENCGKD